METHPIGRRHAVIRRLRRLRRDPATREQEGVFVAEGKHLAREALDAGARIELGLVSSRLADHRDGAAILADLRRRAVPRFEADDDTLAFALDPRSPQGVALVVGRPATGLGRAAPDADDALVLIACGIQDPGNLGSVLRTAEAAGASGAVACGAGADLFHPRAVRAAMGTTFRLPLAAETLTAAMEHLRARGYRFVGASSADGRAYHEERFEGRVALFIGAEGGGLPHEAIAGLDARVHVPMQPPVDSLSVGAAAAAILFEAARQRRAGGRR